MIWKHDISGILQYKWYKNGIFPGFPRFDLFVAVVELWENGLTKGKNMILCFLFHKQTCASIWVII
jgi:hypothetical protein